MPVLTQMRRTWVHGGLRTEEKGNEQLVERGVGGVHSGRTVSSNSARLKFRFSDSQIRMAHPSFSALFT